MRRAIRSARANDALRRTISKQGRRGRRSVVAIVAKAANGDGRHPAASTHRALATRPVPKAPPARAAIVKRFAARDRHDRRTLRVRPIAAVASRAPIVSQRVPGGVTVRRLQGSVRRRGANITTGPRRRRRDRIVPEPSPRVAPQQASRRKPAPAQRAVAIDGLDRIVRTGGDIATTRADHRREHPLVASDERSQRPCQWTARRVGFGSGSGRRQAVVPRGRRRVLVGVRWAYRRRTRLVRRAWRPAARLRIRRGGWLGPCVAVGWTGRSAHRTHPFNHRSEPRDRRGHRRPSRRESGRRGPAARRVHR